MISIEDPGHAEHWAAWQYLSFYDPTRLSVEHEQALVQGFGQAGARLAVIFQDEKPILRFLWHKFLPAEGTASLGFFGFSPDVDDATLQEGFRLALQKIKDPSLCRLIGPMNGNSWFSYRLRVDDHPLHLDWEPKVQPRLERLLKAAGFDNWAHYHSTATAGLKAMQNYLAKDWQRVTERGFTLRAITAKDLQSGALLELHRLSQLGFADNPLFVPLGFEAFAQSYLQGKASRENYLFIAYEPSGRAVAFFLGFLEATHAEASQKTLVLKTAATDPEFRRLGLSNALLYAICQELPTDISDTYISALVFQGWTSESFARHGKTLWEHQYVLRARALL
jgi:ribosomal protein S18 acetylase RimI-like enzyme